MAFTSFTFVAFIFAVVLVANAVRDPSARSWVLLAANTVFIGSYVTHVSQLLPFAAFLGLCFVAVEAVRRTRSTRGQWLAIALIVGTFVVLKRYSFLGQGLALPFPYLVLGLSYVLFRVLHLVIDAQQGELPRAISPRAFFNYTCNFLTFTAGPIQRYDEYAAQAAEPAVLTEARVFDAFARLVKGFLKLCVVSAIFDNLFGMVSARLLDTSQPAHGAAFAAAYLAAAVFYTVYLYANFAGYMDIVIGVGALLGQTLPENFNHPFLARNFLDFWSRWHMTLSNWFRTYLFNPLLKVLATRFTSSKAGPYLGVVAFFVTFTVMGVWHGSTAVFLVYGLLLGAGASVNKLWQVSASRVIGKKSYKSLAERALSVYLSRGLTCAYFALALTCLWVDMSQLRFLLSHLRLAGVVACYLGLSFAAGGAFFVWDFCAAQLGRLHLSEGNRFRGVAARNLGLGFQVLLIATVASFFHKAPEFVYRAF